MITLREYQKEIVRPVFEGWDIENPSSSSARCVMIQLPTGGGKTIIFSYIANQFLTQGHTVLIVAHRKELIEQAADKYRRMYPSSQPADIIMGTQARLFWPKLKVGSVQTLTRRIDLEDPSKDKLQFSEDPKLVVIDEAHHATADGYRKLMRRFPNSLFLMVTATPVRMNGGGFKDIAHRLLVGPTVSELEDMWRHDETKQSGLVPDKIKNVILSASVRSVKKKGWDFDSSQLNKLINSRAACQVVVDLWKEHAAGRKTIAFCCRTAKGFDPHNELLAATFRQNGISAACIHAKTPANERSKILRDFGDGKYSVLTNTEIFTEGFDLPQIDCTLMVRPTLSLALYIQMVGRGKRPAGPDKQDHLVIDFSGNVAYFGRPNAPRKWELGESDEKKKGKDEVLVRVGGQLMLLDQIGQKYSGPVHYELVDEGGDDAAIFSFIRVFDKYYQSNSARASAFHSLKHYLSNVKGKPTLEALIKIEEMSGKDGQGFKKGWAHVQFRSCNSFWKLYDRCKSAADAEFLLQYVEQRFTYTSRGKQMKAPGYAVFKKESKKLHEKLKKNEK